MKSNVSIYALHSPTFASLCGDRISVEIWREFFRRSLRLTDIERCPSFSTEIWPIDNSVMVS